MYNGIGLSTPRGSGTSGHVQRNLAFVPRRENKRQSEESHSEPIIRQANQEILDHEKKREIEIECIELSDKLEDGGYTQEQIDEEVNAYRQKRLAEYERSCKDEQLVDLKSKSSHQSAEAQHKRNTKLEEVFGLSTSQPAARPAPVVIQQEEESWD